MRDAHIDIAIRPVIVLVDINVEIQALFSPQIIQPPRLRSLNIISAEVKTLILLWLPLVIQKLIVSVMPVVRGKLCKADWRIAALRLLTLHLNCPQ
jgi:hypothetical protein